MQEKIYNVERYDLSNDKSLRAWSAADEYLLQNFIDLKKQVNNLCIYNDRFGYLACYLNDENPTIIITHKSQEIAINANLEKHKLEKVHFLNPINTFEKKVDFALIKIPKSLGRFQLFLEQIVQNSSDELTIVCAFMTRHFSAQMLEIAEQYFEVVTQSKAVKKARLITLQKKKNVGKKEVLAEVSYKKQVFQQYLGVFSSKHIDYATQFFLEHLEIKDSDNCILDLGSGNGIIASEILKELPNAEMHLLDDSYLAIASSKLNLKSKNVHHHYNNNLSIFKDETFDLIVSNPPFHIEYEINIQIPLQLFKESFRCLKKGGNLQIVANQHLNYRVHLQQIFEKVEIITQDQKFIVYTCVK